MEKSYGYSMGNVISDDYDHLSDMNTTTLLTVSLLAGVILLLTGTSITSIVRTAFADPNPGNNGNLEAPGQNFGVGHHGNPSGVGGPPGQSDEGNPGNCQKFQGTHDGCHEKP